LTSKFLLAAAIALIPGTLTASTPVTASTLAPTPPMGWNSWNHFGGRVTEQDVMAAADAMVASGMRDAGYRYVNIDDTWEGQRDADGVLHTNTRFPDMKKLGDYIHARGLMFGIYSSPGPRTCANYEGSGGHEQQDADLYASWGVDYLKYDLCSFGETMKKAPNTDAANQLMREGYRKMRNALDHTGRPIVLSLCQYGLDSVWQWGAEVGGNLWRTTGDITDNWNSMIANGFSQAGLSRFAGPGHWNDPDMLEVGNGHMKFDEYVTHMTLWAMLAAPLLAGNDLSKMTDETKSILLNRAVIAIDQDPLGRQGDRLRAEGPEEVWTKPLAGGAMAVALFNRGVDSEPMTFTAHEVGMSKVRVVRDLWSGKTVPLQDSEYRFIVPRHGTVLLRLEP
jgi:alpha-galactosidase